MNPENTLKYIGFGLILGAALGANRYLYISKALFSAIGAGLGLELTTGAVISLIKND